MAKLTWGTKLTCSNCGVRFYDLRRPSVACPKCDTPYSGEIKLKPKPKRTRVPAAAAKQVEKAVVIAAAAAAAAELNKESRASTEGQNTEFDDKELAAIGDAGDVESGKNEELIEDPSELGEDDDDVAGVIDNVDRKEES